MHTRRFVNGGHVVAALGLTAAFLSTSHGVSAQNAKEEFTAWAINMEGVPGRSTTTVDITIERWSTDAERQLLIDALKEKGQDGLLRALQKLPRVGRMRTPDSIGYDLHYARQNPLDEGGRQIVIATDRPIGFWEARNRPRSIDYPFTVIELRLNKDGVGEGKMLPGTKIYIDRKNNLVLENYGTQPVRLTEVKKRA